MLYLWLLEGCVFLPSLSASEGQRRPFAGAKARTIHQFMLDGALDVRFASRCAVALRNSAFTKLAYPLASWRFTFFRFATR